MHQCSVIGAAFAASVCLLASGCGGPEEDAKAQSEALATPTPIQMPSSNLDVFIIGNYDASSRLLWPDSGTKYGGNRFSSAYKLSVPCDSSSCTRVNAFGDTTGQCVSLVKSLSGRTGATTGWSKGIRALDNCSTIPLGTAIARFNGSVYNGSNGNGHVGFLCGCTISTSGTTAIKLCDQNWGLDGLVRRHSLTPTGTGSLSDAGAYYVVLSAQ